MPLSRPEGRPETALVRRVFIGLLVANLMVVAAKFFVGLRAGSLAILGTALDSSVDALNNVLALIVVRVAAKAPDEDHPYGHGKFETLGALLIGVLFARQGWWWVDPAIAIVVALLIVLVAYRILGRTVPVLVDERALPTGEIRQTAEGVPGVKSAYGIRSRGPSDLRYAEVTIAVDRKADVAAAHAIADQVEERLKNDLQLHEVTVHVEPC